MELKELGLGVPNSWLVFCFNIYLYLTSSYTVFSVPFKFFAIILLI